MCSINSLPLVHSLLAQVHGHAERAAFVTPGGPVSYGALGRMIAMVAGRLRSRGVGRRDRVLLVGPNCPQWAAAYFAIHSVGAIAVPIDADTRTASAQWIVGDCEASLAISMVDTALPVPIEDLRSPELPNGNWDFDPQCRAEDVADLLYTSGTTGRKKGVVLTHANIASAATNINAFVQNCGDDVEVVPLPLSHSFGLGRLRCMAQTGNTLALEPGMFNAARLLKLVLELHATGLALVPAGFDLLLRMTKDRLAMAQAHLRYIEIGSAAMRAESRQKLMKLLPNTRICHHYGLTEASRSAFCEYHADADAPKSIGRPSPNVEIVIRDAEGRELPPGEQGELTVRGGMVMREYWKQPQLTASTLCDGWLRTGDLGYKDQMGRLYLSGRKNDVINVGGLKVNPEEVEDALRKHPKVRDVACIGVPDPNGITGECVKAFFVSNESVSNAELATWVRDRLEEYKLPRVWQETSVIPKTPSGKIQRHLLRRGENRDGS